MEQTYLSAIFKDDAAQFGMAGAWHHYLQTDHPGTAYTGGEIHTSPTTGLPTEESVLVVVDAEDHTPFLENPNLIPVSLASLDAVAEPFKPAARLAAIGYPTVLTDLVWGGGRTVREVLNFYGRLNNPDFDVEEFGATRHSG